MVGMSAHRTETQWCLFPLARVQKYRHGCGVLYKQTSLESAQLTVCLFVCVILLHQFQCLAEVQQSLFKDLAGTGIRVALRARNGKLAMSSGRHMK